MLWWSDFTKKSTYYKLHLGRTMRSLAFLLIVSGLLLLSLTDTVSAGEETVSISVDIPMKGYADETTNVSSVTVWHSMDIELNETFTFTFIADNLVNGTEYAFSYVIYSNRGEDLSNASHLFVANGTEEYSYNLEGQLGTPSKWYTDATLEEAGGPNYSGQNCSGFIVKVSFVKNPNGTSETLASFQTNSFKPSGYIYEACNSPINDPGFSIGLFDYAIICIIFVVLPLILVIAVFRGAVTVYRRSQNK